AKCYDTFMLFTIPFIVPFAFCLLSFFFTFTAPSKISTLSLHDALPIFFHRDDLGVFLVERGQARIQRRCFPAAGGPGQKNDPVRSEEHTSELQSRGHLVCRLLLEKKKNAAERHMQRFCNTEEQFSPHVI